MRLPARIQRQSPSLSDPTDLGENGRIDARQQMKNVSTNYVALAVGFVSVLVLTPLLVRHLGDVQFGLWVVVMSVVGYLGLLDLGLRPSVVKFVAEYRARGEHSELREYVSTVFTLYLGAGLVAIAGTVSFSAIAGDALDLGPELDATAAGVFVVGGVGVAIAFVNGLAGGVLEGFQRYDWNNGIAVTTQSVTFAGSLVLLHFGHGLLSFVALPVVATALGMVARLTLVRARLGVRVSIRHFRFGALRKGLSYATWAFVLAIATQLVFQTDSLIISLSMSIALVTVYSIAWRMVDAVNRVVFQTVNICLPLFSDLAARNQAERQRELFTESLRIAMAVAVPCHVTFLLLGDHIIELWIGPGYQSSYTVLVVLSLTFLIHVPAHVSAVLMLGTGKHRALALVSLAAAVVNVVLSIILGLWFGIVGVALATGISFVGALGVIVPMQALRQTGLAVRTYVATLAGPLLVGCAIWAAGTGLAPWLPTSPTLSHVVGMTSTIFALFLLGLITFGMSSADRNRYVGALRRSRNEERKHAAQCDHPDV